MATTDADDEDTESGYEPHDSRHDFDRGRGSGVGHVPANADLDVPEGTEIYRCPYCDYPLQTERLWVLHLGVEHEAELDDAQRERFEAEYDEETHNLFTLHVKLTIVIIVLYFALSYAYMFVWS